MSNQPTLPTYSEVATALKKTPAKLQAAQTHGLFCGLICGTSGKKNNPWESLLPADQSTQKSHDILKQLYQCSYTQLKDFSFEFVLLLPNDSKSLNTRVEALGLWCQGFLTGLKQTHVRIENREDGEVSEALNDIIEIAQVNFDDDFSEDDDENAYIDLVEYVRLAVLMIFQELHPGETEKKSSNNDFLH